MKVRKFHHPSHKLGEEYQRTALKIIFDVKKEDLRKKVILVVGGRLIHS